MQYKYLQAHPTPPMLTCINCHYEMTQSLLPSTIAKHLYPTKSEKLKIISHYTNLLWTQEKPRQKSGHMMDIERDSFLVCEL